MKLELFQIYHLKEMSLSAELFLSCSILQFTFYGISTAYQRKTGFVFLNKQVYSIAILFIVLSLFLILNEDLLIINSFSSNNFIINDYLSFSAKLSICLTSVLFLIFVNISFTDKPIQNNFEYIILVTASVLGLLLLCSSNDLITAYLAIELQSIAFYIMSAFKRNSSYSIESGLKYFIIGSLSSALFLFGSSLIYGSIGTLNLEDLQLHSSLLFTSLPENNFSDNFYSLFFECSLEFSNHMINVNSTTTDSLLDWYVLKNSTVLSFSEIFELSNNTITYPIQNMDLIVSPIKAKFYPYVSEFFFCSKVLSMNHALFELFTIEALNSNWILLDQIFRSFNSSFEFNGSEIVSRLNLDLFSIGFLLICLSLFIKLAIAPFHFWSLDVYEGSPNITTFFFSVVPKIGLFVFLMRICYVGAYKIFVSYYQIYFFLFGVLSIFVGSVGGLEQRKLKTLLAYSSISHTGYLILSFSTANIEGIQMMFYYLIIYMISGLCFWSIYMFLRQKRDFYRNKSNKELGDLLLLKKSNSLLAFILAITLFSIAGIPPMVGFLAKIGIFLVVVKSSAYLISLLSILFSVISTFYYIRIIKILYFENVLVGNLYLPIMTQKSLLISIAALSLILLCVDPMILYLLFYKAFLLVA